MEDFDTRDGSMICTEHPFKNTTPAGGICALCLQEKLGKLVSSSFPVTVFPSSSSSSPFRSDIYSSSTTTTTTLGSGSGSKTMHYSNRSRILYLLGTKKNKTASLQNNNINIVLKRSKSSYDRNPPRLNNNNTKRGGLWSFLYVNSSSKRALTSSKSMRAGSEITSYQPPAPPHDMIEVEENDSPGNVAFDRKVSRSRSVGCGSRSFSGDFFERISTGFGDCTLRRVESQREGKSGIHERVRCGGLFSGFMITSSSSSSSSSIGSNNNNNENEGNVAGGRVTSAGAGTRQQQQMHVRSKSWGWALASPMRAFGKLKKNPDPNPNPKPNLGAMPSLLSVGR